MAEFSVEAIQILESRYLKKDKDGKVVESPDEMLIRVAKHIASAEPEDKREKWQKKFLEIMDSLEFLPNSPTLMNSKVEGTGQLSACLSGDTLIRTCSGDFSIKELSEKYSNSKEKFDVYSFDGSKVVIGKASNPRISRENAPIYNVSFDDGSCLKATSDHLIMLRSGKYKEIKDLVIGESIMPFNHTYNNGYLIIFSKIDRYPIAAHKLVYKTFSKEETQNTEVLHHIDYNKKNNSFSNLKKMDKKEHILFHSQNGPTRFQKGFKPWNKNLTKEIEPKLAEIGRKNAIANTGLIRDLTFREFRRKLRKDKTYEQIFGTERALKVRKKLSSSLKNSLIAKEYHARMSKKGTEEKACLECGNTFSSIKSAHRQYCGINCCNKAMNKRRWSKYYSSYNHKVLSVEFVGYEDVYDLSVEKYHNFVANNVFVHNCFVLPIEDSLSAIFEIVKESSLIFKSGGGCGYNFSHLRPKGSIVSTTKGVASGVVSFMRVFNSATEAVRQGGVRRGASIGLLNADHPEIFDFINCKKDTTEMTNFNISVAIKNDFLDRVKNNKPHYLINPYNKVKTEVSAKEIFDLICQNIWNNGEPGIVFLDEINAKNSAPWLGKIEATNPCGEQPLLPWECCTLGSINISKFCKDGEINWNKLLKTVEIAVRFLDDVVDVNKYPRVKIARKALSTRKIGLGLMGWADLLLLMKIRYDSNEALNLAEKLMSTINNHARRTSEELGREKGFCPGGNGKLKRRNVAITTIAPTGTLSLLADCSSSIEPIFAKKFTKKVLGTIKLDLSKKYGEIIGDYFVTALEIKPEWHVRMQAAFQKYVDNAVSKTINLPYEATVEDIKNAIFLAHSLGCKGLTCYRQGTREAPLEISTEGLSECENGKCAL